MALTGGYGPVGLWPVGSPYEIILLRCLWSHGLRAFYGLCACVYDILTTGSQRYGIKVHVGAMGDFNCGVGVGVGVGEPVQKGL